MNIFACIGGIFFILYFFKVGYLPSIVIEDLIFSFIVSGLTGIAFLSIAILCMVYPFMVFEIQKPKELRDITYTACEKKEKEFKNYFISTSISIFFIILYKLFLSRVQSYNINLFKYYVYSLNIFYS